MATPASKLRTVPFRPPPPCGPDEDPGDFSRGGEADDLVTGEVEGDVVGSYDDACRAGPDIACQDGAGNHGLAAGHVRCLRRGARTSPTARRTSADTRLNTRREAGMHAPPVFVTLFAQPGPRFPTTQGPVCWRCLLPA